VKKIFFLILIVLIGWGVWYVYQSRSSSTTPPVKLQPVVAHPDPSNGTFVFEDGAMTLKNGSHSDDSGDTNLTDTIAYGDVNKDGKNDTAALLMQTSSGTGTFFYLVAYVSGIVQYKGTNAIFIGDRIAPKSIAIDANGVINVTYLDRKDGEPFTDDPTVSVTKQYVYAQGAIAEKN
jgi:hypothetical protein